MHSKGESGRSKGSQSIKVTAMFEELVLKWTLKDVMDENRFAQKVKQIPEKFTSVVEYLGSFVWPLIEETRAQLQQGLESISEEQSRSITFHEKRLLEGELRNYNIHYTEGQKDEKRKLKWKPKDILILSTKFSENLEYFHDEYLLAIVQEPWQETAKDGFKVKLYMPNGHPFASEKYSKKSEFFAFYVGSIISSLRIWKALHAHLQDEEKNLIMLHKAICFNTKDHKKDNTEVKEDGLDKFRSKHFMPHDLNDSQISAVIQAVNAVESKYSSDIKLIQGPPGTGKTSMLISLLSILGHKMLRVLVCAPTNAAISEVAMRFVRIVTSPSGSCPDEDNFPCVMNLGDLVLVGNEERFDREGILGNIFFKDRIDRLYNCFLPMTGWRYSVTSLLDFLESAVSQYEVSQETDSLDFSQSIRQRLQTLTSKFCEAANTLLNDLPGALSGKQELECLINAVESFVNFIENHNVKESVLIECCCSNSEGLGEAEGSTSIVNKNMRSNEKDLKVFICLKRSECIQLLRKHLSSQTDIAHMAQKVISPDHIESTCLSHAKLVFSTVSSSARGCMNETAPFDCLIIDEAAQLTEAESTIALQTRGVRHAILIGDPYQLPATVISLLSQKAGYGRSLFERLQLLGHPVHLLNTQYRMHPSISQFPNMAFYGNCIMNGPNVNMEAYGNAYITSEMYGTYAFVNIADAREAEDGFGKSKQNVVEAAVVLHMIAKLFKVCAARQMRISVGVISPYSAQVRYLESKLTSKDEWMNNIDIEVKSVDGFQGGEKDIIIISTVRTNNNIGFLSDWRRANVALTRARFCLWIVGNGSMLVKTKSIWKEIAKDAIARKCFLDPNVDSGMVKTIRNAKAEMDQLEDLLKTDSILFNNTVWKVTFSSEFKDSFTKLKGLDVRQQIINTLLKLANGWRQARKHAGSAQKSLINEYVTSGLHLVWTTDVERGEQVFQILKIWNVLRLEELPNLRQRLENVFTTYTPEYIDRCKAKFLDKDGKTVLPRRWKDDPEFVWYKRLQKSEMLETPRWESFDKETVSLEHARVEESLLLMKFYSLTSGIANQLLTATDGSEIGLQFEVNDEESRIIRFPRSSFILGRSGTGKTTVLTTKLLKNEQQLNLAIRGISSEKQTDVESTSGRNDLQQEYHNASCLRQMFVTVSAKLCSAIRNHISHTDSFVQGQDRAHCMEMLDSSDSLQEFENIPDSFIDIDDKHFPLVITFQKFLIMLDGSVPYHFFRDRCSKEQGYQLQKKGFCSNEVTGEEVDSTKSDSNREYFDDGGQDAEILDDQEFFVGVKGPTYKRSLAFMQIMRKNEVNYERFDSVYWPHFNAELRRGLDSSVVFTEIISHIKGSSKSVSSADFRTSRDEYIAMGESRVSTLHVKQREAIYKIFLHYEKKKQRNGNFDIADVVNHLHRQIQSNGYLGVKLNFIYVDEVQDLPMAQISLFKYVCSNVREGFVFAGDTAQTIARGVYFRFEDIRNLFYKEFLEADNDQTKKINMPDLFHLTQNFRTHTGITKLAHSVVELLYHYFPFAVDKLSPETSLIYGEAPTFLDTKEGENPITTIFGHGRSSGSEKYEFGAEQAILVRDDNQKVQVLEQVGKQCLVLTVFECKGLEFQDVLLYNFFSSSPLGTKWRVIYDFMNQKGLDSCEQNQYPKFDSIKHNLLCSEVKHLYVAITRSKERLWIYEENPKYAKPMLDYWKQKDIIQYRCFDRSMVESMYVASSCEDWRKRGIQMFNEKNYNMAVISFERAGDMKMAKWAKARKLQEDGQRNLETHKEAAKHFLIEAAKIFLSIGKPDSAAYCFILMGEYIEAGRIYEEKCSETRLEDAGDCFSEAKCWHNAAGAYARANCLSKCLNACIKGKLFDIGLEFIEVLKMENCKSNCGKCEACDGVKIKTEYLKMCSTHFHQKKDTKSMMKFVKAFPTMDLIRSFLWRKGYFDELLEIEETNENFMQAAQVAEMKGDLFLEAVKYLKACAMHFHQKRDTKSMMKFVKAFPTMDLIRSFLWRRDYFDELLEIEETNGNFIQAAQVVEMKGDLFLEAVKYLKACAMHFHQKKDTKSMMKFVKAFPTMDLIRDFLWSKDYFDELLEIEVTNGDFVEAAHVAEMKVDLLLEADMLEKAEKYEKAVDSILQHVQLSSLWGMENKGWPLQHFHEKNQLVERIKQIAEQNLLHVPQTLYCLDCKASILLSQSQSLSKLKEQMILAQKIGNVNFEVLSLRKVLDVHLHSDVKTFQHEHGRSFLNSDDNSKVLLENTVSSTAMMFLWNAWKEKLLSSVDSLSKLEKHREKEEDKIYIEFALEYFGTRVSRNNGFCTVFNSEAFWLKGRKDQLLQRRGNCAQITIQNFSMYAKEFLLMEMFSVGEEVVKKLHEIYLSCKNQHCALTVEGTLILQIYLVSNALEDKLLARFGQVTRSIRIQCLKERFFEVFFPLNTQYENTKEFISLRENSTSSLILKDITVNIINKIGNGITLGQVGRLQLLLPFLPRELVTNYGKKVIKSLHDKNCWNNELLWLPMETLTGYTFKDKRMDLIKSFQAALTSTFQEWGKHGDYISPNVFLSLLEKLFFFSSSCEYLSGGLFLPRSFCVEFITGEQGNPTCAWFCQSKCLPRCQGRLERFYRPIYNIIYQLLVTYRAETFRWIQTFKIDSRAYFPELAVRLIIMLCLIGVNSIGLFQNAMHVLSTIIQDKHIRMSLTPKFGGKLLQLLQQYNPNRDAFFIGFSQLMRQLDNPLVMIDLDKSLEHESNPADLIVIGPESIKCKEILLQSVFQDKGDVIASKESEGDMKSKELPIHCKNSMQPSNISNFETNTKHISESFKAEESVSDSSESLRDKQENTLCTPLLDSGDIDQQKKIVPSGVDFNSRDKNVHFSLLEDIKPSYKFEVDGHSLPWFVQWRMKRWLSCARRHLEETLSIKDKYIREACEVFKGNTNSSYTEIFISKACPLKAEVDELLDLIKTTTLKVRQGKVRPDEENDVLEEMHNIHEELLNSSKLLQPRHKKHEEYDIEWLQKDAIGHTSTKLQESRDKWNGFKSVF
ncbi:hypothetical protein SUGI_0684510 [Cryptomeria japonica]|uniref:uncharacterized protein LOC131045892 n=1 Tax=Cryptomeria japonica TaxID=3369 RepID=UPI0024149C69|nr:uncharacterized protein LOC131045892 [Cryptomeria japonica]GLJ34036.1 hypothetical protein SUGI_0684510 [Cryptomeria japonica]